MESDYQPPAGCRKSSRQYGKELPKEAEEGLNVRFECVLFTVLGPLKTNISKREKKPTQDRGILKERIFMRPGRIIIISSRR